MHEDLEKRLTKEVWDLTPLELVTQLAYSGLPAHITVSDPRKNWLRWFYLEKEQFTLPICLVERPNLTVAGAVRLDLFRCPSIYCASQYSKEAK